MSIPAFSFQEVKERSVWDAFMLSVDPHTFLQSWPWGEFNRRQGNDVWRWQVHTADAGSAPVGAIQAVHIQARRGRFLFCPHGPILADQNDAGALRAALRFLVEEGRGFGSDFVRVSSLQPDTDAQRRLFRQSGFRPAPIHMHPELAWLLDVHPDGSALLSGMRKTMRQLIRKSQQLGITVRATTAAADADIFLNLYRDTAERQHFVAFSDRYVADELAAFGDDIRILLAEYQGTVLAGAVVVFSGRSAFYHHGASLPQGSNLPAAYLLQWEAIQLAKLRGCQWYNFWGIAPANRPNHPWTGLTAFKQGFGGFSESYLHAQDHVLRTRYWLNYAVECARRARRGL
ncbi:MAG: peptidoglycan bridge formation glycyltransferase FemA/FemB family protein [bacterium]|nr:peptidoglycan bridge formation glycyltransferase FemA/FemB family protein [bacterium]